MRAKILLLVPVIALTFLGCGQRTSSVGSSGSAATGAGAGNPPLPGTQPAGTSSFSTSFSSTENPISESGKWVNGKTDGLDWNDVQTTPGKAFASMLSGFNGASRYNDSIAHLNTSFMTFPADQYAQGTVYRASSYDPSPSKHEVELHLRFQTTKDNARGYEIMWGITGYLAVVRWNGVLGNYTSIIDTGDAGGIGVPMDGDVLRAEIKGNIITIFKNGVAQKMVDVTPAGPVWPDGQPGMGFWPVDSSTPQNYGWKKFEAGIL